MAWQNCMQQLTLFTAGLSCSNGKMSCWTLALPKIWWWTWCQRCIPIQKLRTHSLPLLYRLSPFVSHFLSLLIVTTVQVKNKIKNYWRPGQKSIDYLWFLNLNFQNKNLKPLHFFFRCVQNASKFSANTPFMHSKSSCLKVSSSHSCSVCSMGWTQQPISDWAQQCCWWMDKVDFKYRLWVSSSIWQERVIFSQHLLPRWSTSHL